MNYTCYVGINTIVQILYNTILFDRKPYIFLNKQQNLVSELNNRIVKALYKKLK